MGVGGPGGGGTYPVIITYQIFSFRWTNPIKIEKNDSSGVYTNFIIRGAAAAICALISGEKNRKKRI